MYFIVNALIQERNMTYNGLMDYQRNNTLDFVKGIGCVGVVFIHIMFPGMLGSVIMKASQFAVPIFLLTTGYYCYNCKNEILFRRMMKIVTLLIKSLVFYCLFTLSLRVASGNLDEWLQAINWIKIVRFFLIGDYDVIGGGTYISYLYSF